MFTPDSNESYMMPPMFGPKYSGPGASGWYRDVTLVVASYLTDADALAQLLPAPFRPAADPVITVNYARNRDIDWLAGRGYNLIGVSAAVEFEGKQDVLSGNFCLVMWENLTDPILNGREAQGIPKLFADIPDHTETDGHWQVSASHYGSDIVSLGVRNLQPVSEADIAAHAESRKGLDHPMSWRYFPGLGGGEPFSQFSTYPSESKVDKAWVGEGAIAWNTLTWEQNPTQFHIVNTLAALPVVAMLPGLVTRGSANLSVPDRPTRTIC